VVGVSRRYFTKISSIPPTTIAPLLFHVVFQLSEIFCLSFAINLKLNDSKMTALISKVDRAGSGALRLMTETSIQTKTVGKPGEWSVATCKFPGGVVSFLHEF
jgi:hypothetical protein